MEPGQSMVLELDKDTNRILIKLLRMGISTYCWNIFSTQNTSSLPLTISFQADNAKLSWDKP
jgi:hypothetical protein